ncbi:MAG: CBS domain-containing protein, partial [Deltaproteobacteria bacterium]|nr:CBS domain-containing protein [Deltaproteobacteria bacterium]
MTKNHIRHMPVMKDNNLVGILSLDDVRKVT